MTPWTWWWSTDGDRERCFGPCATREEALKAAADAVKSFVDKATIYLQEARHLDISDIEIDAFEILERLDTHYEDELDPDSAKALIEATPEQIKALSERFTACLHGWAMDKGIKGNFFMFSETRNESTVDWKRSTE